MSTLDRFAKVRALHDRTDNRHERKVAATKMKALAREAGMTVAQAKRKLDAPPVVTPAQAAASAFNDFFNSPEMRARAAEREREKQARRVEILAQYGSEEAVHAETDREAALRRACLPFTIWDRRPGYERTYTLSGWKYFDGRSKLLPAILDAVKAAWPLPPTVKEAWAEYRAAEALDRDRQTMVDWEHYPELWVEVRRYVLEDLLDTLPASSIGDVLARLSWMENANEFGRSHSDQAAIYPTLRADIERMSERMRQTGEAA